MKIKLGLYGFPFFIGESEILIKMFLMNLNIVFRHLINLNLKLIFFLGCLKKCGDDVNKLMLLSGSLVLLPGCSLFGYKNSQNTIYIENTATIKYTGKDAAASFALIGAMGSVGAAIR